MTLLLAMSALAVAEACSCEGMPIARAMRRSRVVFSGRVIELQDHGRYSQSAVFAVDETLAGRLRAEHTVSYRALRSPEDRGMCGFEVALGETWLVFAYGRRNHLSMALCWGHNYALDGDPWDAVRRLERSEEKYKHPFDALRTARECMLDLIEALYDGARGELAQDLERIISPAEGILVAKDREGAFDLIEMFDLMGEQIGWDCVP